MRSDKDAPQPPHWGRLEGPIVVLASGCLRWLHAQSEHQDLAWKISHAGTASSDVPGQAIRSGLDHLRRCGLDGPRLQRSCWCHSCQLCVLKEAPRPC